MPSRADSYLKLMDSINNQYDGNEVEIITDMSMADNIGVKRNNLLNMSSGEYVVFIDDDDTISNNYVRYILDAMGADCIGISGIISTNGTAFKQWHISKDYGSWYEKDNIYYRTPNHISPVRREIALQVGFPEIVHGEDYAYSMGLLPLLKTENKIKENIYRYNFTDK